MSTKETSDKTVKGKGGKKARSRDKSKEKSPGPGPLSAKGSISKEGKASGGKTSGRGPKDAELQKEVSKEAGAGGTHTVTMAKDLPTHAPKPRSPLDPTLDHTLRAQIYQSTFQTNRMVFEEILVAGIERLLSTIDALDTMPDFKEFDIIGKPAPWYEFEGQTPEGEGGESKDPYE
jgi:hypothetical protein